MYTERISREYANGCTDIGANDPYLGLDLINELIDTSYDHINISDLNLESF